MLARRFLYVIATLIMLLLAAGIAWSLFQDQLMRAAFVPSAQFKVPAGTAPNYRQTAAWVARPGLADDPARFVPPGFVRRPRGPVAVFYVAPTTYLRRDRWNAPLDDREANQRLDLFASSQASAFNGLGPIWAPRYRQATMGAFLTDSNSATRALDFAYADVARAFDVFLKSIAPDRPILLAGHSQGSLHLLRLMREKVAGRPVAKRIVAAYLVGWPISIEADVPAMGLPACTAAGQPGCILSWQSFAEPADPHLVTRIFDHSRGLTGRSRGGTHMLCINPLTGTPGAAAPAAANRGALVPRERLDGADLKPGLVPARCDPSGFLLIGAEPEGYNAYVLPGRNYHVFDYAMFWASIRADAEARAAAYLKRG